jgi:hypothetical protein
MESSPKGVRVEVDTAAVTNFLEIHQEMIPAYLARTIPNPSMTAAMASRGRTRVK